MTETIKIFLDQGVLGAVAIISLFAARKMYLDRKAADERLLRKAEKWAGKYWELAGKLSDALGQVSMLGEQLAECRAENERLKAENAQLKNRGPHHA